MTPVEHFHTDLTRHFLIAEGLTNSAGYAIGATTITLDSFTGVLMPGDPIQFAGDAAVYYLDSTFVGTVNPAAILLATGLLQALPTHAVAVVALGLPAMAVLPRFCSFDDTEMQLPMIALAANESKGKHPLLKNVTVFVRLRIQSSAGAVDDHTPGLGTPTVDAIQWAEQIRARLASTEGFRAQLLALDASARTGSQLMTRILDHNIAHSIDRENRTQTWELIVENKVMILQ
jgi:hypothetical protein